MAKITFNQLHGTLVTTFGDEIANRIASLIEDRGGGLSDAQLAHIGTALAFAGDVLIGDLRERILVKHGQDEAKEISEEGVKFTVKPAHVRQIIDSDYVKEKYPKENQDFAQFWKNSNVKETVAIKIPKEEE